jgi:hypothetical protein
LITHAAQIPGWVATNAEPLTLHPMPLVAKVSAPEPDPVVLVKVIGVPATPVVTEFVTRRPSGEATMNVNATVALDTLI